MIAEASDINVWKEWAKIEDCLAKETKYSLPKIKKGYGFTPYPFNYFNL